MLPTLTLTRDHVTPTLRDFSRVMRKELPWVVTEAAKRTTREVIAITPPGSAGITGKSAEMQGRSKIARDLHNVFAPVRLKGRKVVTQVFGRPLGTPIVIKTVEKYPDLVSVYRQNSIASKSRVGIRGVRQGQKYYVDERKFKRLYNAKIAKIGKMASGWTSAANKLGVAVPAWIRRHGQSRGSIDSQLATDQLYIRVINFAPNVPDNVVSEMERRIPYAMRYALNGMRRNIDVVAAKSARAAKIRTVRIQPGGSII